MTIIIVLGNVYRRYISSHKYFEQRSHLGYFAIPEEALPYLPDDIKETLVEIPTQQTVFIFVAGTA